MHTTTTGNKIKALQWEALALKPLARLEDLHVWELEKVKTTKKGSRSYLYWMATWREGGKTRNVHLGSAKKMSQDEARQKAMRLKAASISLKPWISILYEEVKGNERTEKDSMARSSSCSNYISDCTKRLGRRCVFS
jgi:hypothetical protein